MDFGMSAASRARGAAGGASEGYRLPEGRRTAAVLPCTAEVRIRRCRLR